MLPRSIVLHTQSSICAQGEPKHKQEPEGGTSKYDELGLFSVANARVENASVADVAGQQRGLWYKPPQWTFPPLEFAHRALLEQATKRKQSMQSPEHKQGQVGDAANGHRYHCKPQEKVWTWSQRMQKQAWMVPEKSDEHPNHDEGRRNEKANVEKTSLQATPGWLPGAKLYKDNEDTEEKRRKKRYGQHAEGAPKSRGRE